MNMFERITRFKYVYKTTQLKEKQEYYLNLKQIICITCEMIEERCFSGSLSVVSS
jgi:hypothetical protein